MKFNGAYDEDCYEKIAEIFTSILIFCRILHNSYVHTYKFTSVRACTFYI